MKLIKRKETINSFPIEFQSKGALELLEKAVKSRPSEKFALNHSHAFPQHLPTSKGLEYRPYHLDHIIRTISYKISVNYKQHKA